MTPPSIADIQTAVSRHYRLPVTALLGPDRWRPFSRPRQVAMYLARSMTTASLPKIGREFGGRHHTTVLHAQREVERLANEDPAVAADLAALRACLAGSFA
jgi:chromosomal replication initiator protein